MQYIIRKGYKTDCSPLLSHSTLQRSMLEILQDQKEGAVLMKAVNRASSLLISTLRGVLQVRSGLAFPTAFSAVVSPRKY